MLLYINHRSCLITLVCLWWGLNTACGSKQSLDDYVMATVASRTYTATVSLDGELDAKVSRVLVVPRVRVQPTLSYLANEGTTVEKDSIVAVFESNELVTEYRNAVDESAIARADLEGKKADMRLQRLVLESEVQRVEATAATARLQLPKLAFAAVRAREVEELEMKKSEIEALKLHKKLVSLDSIEREEMTHLDLKIKLAEAKLSSAEATITDLSLRAPTNGFVVHMTNWNTGQKIKEGESLYPGWPVAKIPDLSVMQVNVQASETDAKRLKAGQRAEVTIPSLNNLKLPGHITNVAGMAKPISRDSQVKRVDVVVEIDSLTVPLTPGLSATCRIVVEEQGQALVVPLDSIFEQDSLKVVYVKDGNHFVRRNVTLAQQGLDFAVISTGVKENDELALRQPNPELVLQTGSKK